MSKKITTELIAFRKLVRTRDFVVANRERFGAETPAATAVSGVISTVTNLGKLTTEQAGLENRLRELSRIKLEARAALRKEVEALGRIEGELVEIRKLAERVSRLEQWQA